MNIRDWLPFINQLPEVLQPAALGIALVIITALLVFVLHWLLTWLLLRPLQWVVRRSPTEVDDSILELSIAPLRIAGIGIALMISLAVFNYDAEAQRLGNTVGRALIIAAAFFALIRYFGAISQHPVLFGRITGLAIPERLLPFLNTAIKYLISTLGAIFVLQELGLDVAALIASLGVVGIGISLASQNTVGNVFGFAAIVTDNPFKVGDFIRTPDVTGIVEKVGARSTRIRQLDQAMVTVPNNLLTDAIVLNWSRLERRRLDVTLSFTYSTTTDQMRAAVDAIRDMLKQADEVDPETVIVHFVDFSSSSLDVRVICQVLHANWTDFTACKEQLYLEIMGIVEGLGICFAFPSRSLYLEDADGLARLADHVNAKEGSPAPAGSPQSVSDPAPGGDCSNAEGPQAS